ncbi:ABC transporter permease subunit [Alkalihalobacillus sp. AL-G]|uniref:ABC transporter permease subunit n=1 Tax=Alkalihalobacillus sp. AL-G TaxID=2926399 RepID=UPI00272C98A4|nr:ABC transporter permease subunit [Alkalihalobacillus sp. AL-G]WLD94773.1 ABC transporter permease subunit [Alkalihalobacillus sp. AL-G]
MRTFRVLSIEFVLTIVGIVLLGKLPYLFFNMKEFTDIKQMLDTGMLRNTLFINYFFEFNWERYWSAIIDTWDQLLHLSSLTYYTIGYYEPVFPEMWENYVYSIKVLGSAFLLGTLIAVIVTYLLMLCSNSMIRKVGQSIISAFQLIPDIFLILLMQFIIIYIYKTTDVLVFNILASYGDPAYGLPILCLTVLPTVFLIKTLILIYEEELEKRYVETAKAKGVKRSGILIVHIFRNALISMFNHSKMLLWFTLSNLLMLEVLFNIDGFTSFLWKAGTLNPHIFTVGLLMIFIPFFFIFVISGLLIANMTNKQEAVFE